jgi:transcriptional regulator with XRE-family HTH domain
MAITTRRTPTTAEGSVSGYVLKLCRATAGLDQQRFAEQAGVGVTTIQGWESGRMPLSAVQVARYTAIRHQLLRAGTPLTLLHALQDALDVDHLIGRAIEYGQTAPTPHAHPLANWVLPKAAADLFAWALGGEAPSGIAAAAAKQRRHGPSPTRPHLPAAAREQIISHLRCLADQASTRGEPYQLLWRQAFYLLGYDKSHDSGAFLRRTRTRTIESRHPSPAALTSTRSVATALARRGDPDRLRWFIDRTGTDEHAERVNLAYWAYWVGELPGPQHDDHFMATTSTADYGGAAVLNHLTDRLLPNLGYLDLTAHTLWSLTAAKPHLLAEHPTTAQVLSERTTVLLDHPDQLSPRARREITDIRYALRLAGHR